MLNARSNFQFRGGTWKPSNRFQTHEVWLTCNSCPAQSDLHKGIDVDTAVRHVLQWATLAGWARIDNEEFCPECAVKQAHRLESAGGRGGTTT